MTMPAPEGCTEQTIRIDHETAEIDFSGTYPSVQLVDRGIYMHVLPRYISFSISAYDLGHMIGQKLRKMHEGGTIYCDRLLHSDKPYWLFMPEDPSNNVIVDFGLAVKYHGTPSDLTDVQIDRLWYAEHRFFIGEYPRDFDMRAKSIEEVARREADRVVAEIKKAAHDTELEDGFQNSYN